MGTCDISGEIRFVAGEYIDFYIVIAVEKDGCDRLGGRLKEGRQLSTKAGRSLFYSP